VKIEEGDQLLSAAITDGSREILIATRSGMSIRFSEEQVRPTGRATMGVKGIELDDQDVVVGLGVTGDDRDRVLAVCERGYGKQTALEEFRLQSRGGKGVILIDASDRNGPVVGIALVGPSDECILVTDRGQTLRTQVSQIRETGRNAQGVRLMNVDEGERIVAIEAFAEADDGNNSTPPPENGAPSVPPPPPNTLN
jgi:DNA gyrase subunit A